MYTHRHFDAQLHTAIETLRAKENDLKELIQMSTDAHRAKEAAKAELGRLEQTIAEERKIRQKVLVCMWYLFVYLCVPSCQ
jgi:hypothetical protein